MSTYLESVNAADEAFLVEQERMREEFPPFRPDYDWTSTCPHDATVSDCPDGDGGCRCECHAVPER